MASGFLFLDSLGVSGEKGINLGAVVGVSDEVGKFALHLSLGQLVDAIELFPEEFFSGHGSLVREIDGTEAHGVKNAHSGLEASVILEVVKVAAASLDVNVEAGSSGHIDPAGEGVGIGLGDFSRLNELSKTGVEHVFTVVLPDTAEVRLSGNSRGHLVRETEVLLLHDLRSESANGFVFLTELGATLFGGGVHAEDHTLVLVGVGERVEETVTGFVIVLVLEHVSTVAPPGGLGDFVVEETGGETLAPLLETEPLENIGFLAFTRELHGGPLGVHVEHGVVPSLARVGVKFPAVLFLGGGPVRGAETLEHDTGHTVGSDFADTLEEGGGVEVLGVHVHHDIGFLVELVAIDVLNTDSYNN